MSNIGLKRWTPEQGVIQQEGFYLLPIEALRPAPWNYKQPAPGVVEALKNNIQRQGFVENIAVSQLDDQTFEVGNGNHRLEAAQALGLRWLPAYVHICDEHEFKRRVIEQNETKVPADMTKLVPLVKELTLLTPMDELKATIPLPRSVFQLIEAQPVVIDTTATGHEQGGSGSCHDDDEGDFPDHDGADDFDLAPSDTAVLLITGPADILVKLKRVIAEGLDEQELNSITMTQRAG